MQRSERDARRVSPAALLRRLDERLALGDGARIALVAIALSPSDRRLALGHGHAERATLAEVARRVESVLRAPDCYAFASREEVWVLLPDLPSESLAELAGSTLLDRLLRPIAAPAVPLQPTVGIAWTAASGRIDALSVLAVANEAAAARHGSRRVQLRRVRATRDNAPVQRQVEQDLARALDANALEVHFQPQVDLRSGRCRSAEALIRWRHPDGRTVNPEDIVAICEKRDLILQLTRFTLNTTLRQMSGWDAYGFELTVAVNLSAATLSDPSLPLMVSQALDTWDIPPERLTLELTESALIRNQQVACETMVRLKALGCRLSIDDFGTGYSPYTYLRQFSFDELKIDQSFVKRTDTRAADLRIVQSLVDLAHTFGMHAVAEGVEDAATADALRALGCDLAQGWHVSAALAPEPFARWYRAHAPNEATAR